MASTSRLCGPPEINHLPQSSAAGGGEMETNLHFPATPPRMGFTENRSLTYLATGNPCLDFFFHVVPTTPSDQLIQRLTLSWNHNPLTAVKLICHLRGVRGTGKSDRESFYTAALWLHKHHPKTLACNVAVFAQFGYLKDLLEILYRLLEGPEVRSTAKIEWNRNKKCSGRTRKMFYLAKKRSSRPKRGQIGTKKKDDEKKRRLRAKVPREKRVEANLAKVKEERERARVLRKEKEFSMAKRAFERYNSDSDYKFLHDQISSLFADLLKSDMQNLNSGETMNISLAAKWCPTIDSAYDKATLICESIARKIFPRDSDPEYESIEAAHYVYRVRDRLRKQVLVPLHKVLKLPEVYMSAQQWKALPYNRVASVAMKNYKNIFLQRDNKRFNGYLEDVKLGKAKIAAGALLPHEIVASLNDPDGGKVAELQWARMVDDVAKMGRLRNCIAVCDVSGSMDGEPMEVCVALGLLISELSEEPWKGNVITFSANPQLHKVEGNSLLEKTKFVREMEWGSNTDFQRVFDRILEVAVAGNLNEDQMIKKVFVFSDMEFDQASGHSRFGYGYGFGYGYNGYGNFNSHNDTRPKGWETDYEVIQRKFSEKGYNKLPEIVFWNLRNSLATPVTAKQSGVALVSGYSKNMVTVFLKEDGLVNPETVMEHAIAGEEYQKLVVYD
ncbi:hypothetical protein TEA_015066 [Camellia sinensis var. sinensis]|uniref:TROVE domain-containing protein n=2 Tax=Camellia sinensis TaxID=4442 RepID=A0A4S4DY95_CAMSN|nr:hypothetical protein TEA_015066 [Camellia sinensis var. sinensis]